MNKTSHKGLSVRRGLPSGLSGSPVPYRVGSAEDKGIITLFKNTLIGLGIALAIGLLGVTVAAAVAYANPDPDSMMRMIFWIPIALAFFSGGFSSGRLMRSNPLLCGLLPAVYLFLLFLLLGAFFSREYSSGYTFWQMILLYLGLSLTSFGGALVGAREKKVKPGNFKYKKK